MARPTRFLYFCADVDAPSGGVKGVYTHVYLLNTHGLPAFVVHADPNYAYAFTDLKVPILSHQGLAVYPEDAVIVPEGFSMDALKPLRGVRKYAFVQSAAFAFAHADNAQAWREAPLDGALCCSRLTLDFARSVLGLENAALIPNAVDPALFRPRPKKLHIAYMPRKLPEEIALIRAIFRCKYPERETVPWVALDRLHERETAALLGESAVLMSTSLFEGFNLPPLEAMACETLVVGGHGYGGREYAADDNGLWCEQGNVLQIADRLAEALDLAQEAGPALAARKSVGRQTAARYSPEAQEAALLEAWRRFGEPAFP